MCHGVPGGYDISCKDSYCGRLKKTKRQVETFSEENDMFFVMYEIKKHFTHTLYIATNCLLWNFWNFRTRHCLKPRGRPGGSCSKSFPCRAGFECRDDLNHLWDGKVCQKSMESKTGQQTGGEPLMTSGVGMNLESWALLSCSCIHFNYVCQRSLL